MSTESKDTQTSSAAATTGKVMLQSFIEATGQLLSHAIDRSDRTQHVSCQCRCNNAGVCPAITYMIAPVNSQQIARLADLIKKAAPEGHTPCHFTWGYDQPTEDRYDTFVIGVTFARDAATAESDKLWNLLVRKPKPVRKMNMGEMLNDLLGKALPSWNA